MTRVESAPRNNSSWVPILSLFTLASLAETVFYSQMLAFTPLFLPRLGITEDAQILLMVGWMTAVSNGIGLPFLPFWGALADRYSRKPIIIRSFGVIALAALLASLAPGLALFFIARSITGFALGNSGLMMTTLSERVPQKRIGFAFSVMNSAAPIGAFLGPLTGGWVVDSYGFRNLMLVNLVGMLIVIGGLAIGYRDTYRGSQSEPLLKMAWESVRVVWESKRLRLLFPALLLLFGGWMLAFTYIPLVITDIYTGTDPGTAVGLVIGASGLTTLLISPLLGALADRLGNWRVLFAGAAAALILWPLPALTRDLIPFAILWSVLNGVVSAVFALSFSVLSSSATERIRGRVMSFAYMPVNFGFMIGPAIGTWITQRSLFAIFPASAVLTGAGLFTLILAHRQPLLEDA
jgi:DHA1 family multidrug resistance protein-like MFS transporter